MYYVVATASVWGRAVLFLICAAHGIFKQHMAANGLGCNPWGCIKLDKTSRKLKKKTELNSTPVSVMWPDTLRGGTDGALWSTLSMVPGGFPLSLWLIEFICWIVYNFFNFIGFWNSRTHFNMRKAIKIYLGAPHSSCWFRYGKCRGEQLGPDGNRYNTHMENSPTAGH